MEFSRFAQKSILQSGADPEQKRHTELLSVIANNTDPDQLRPAGPGSGPLCLDGSG
jgi:hypothetical protein